jgi:DNA-directed RNA polymerase specialized sigma24 family protein
LLPAQLRIILLLNRVGGYTIEEISRAFGMTRGQVSGRLYKAEEMFRRLIGGEARPREEAGR